MSDYTTVTSTSDLQPGQGRCYEVGSTHVAVFNVEGTFYAIDNICPHANGPLGEGDLEDSVVSCPLHGWTFDVTTGQCGFMPDVSVKTYPCRLDGDQVQVGVS